MNYHFPKMDYSILKLRNLIVLAVNYRLAEGLAHSLKN